MNIKALAAIVAVTLVAAASSPVTLAHSTGHESRTAAECERLPGTAKEGERAGCLACVGRNNAKMKYHFHPEYPAGNRCRPDNGKP